MTRHCKNNQEKVLVEYIKDRLQEDGEKAAIEAYTTILYQILYNDFNLVNYKYYEFDWVLEFQNKNFMLFNEILHYVHTRYPAARSEAVEAVGKVRQKEYDEKTSIEVVFMDRYIKSDFDSKLKSQIEKALSPIMDDLKIIYTQTWFYSHLTMGMSYTYKNAEHPRLEIYFPAQDIKQKVINLLKKEFNNEKIEIN